MKIMKQYLVTHLVGQGVLSRKDHEKINHDIVEVGFVSEPLVPLPPI
jgi:hypothetical protein